MACRWPVRCQLVLQLELLFKEMTPSHAEPSCSWSPTRFWVKVVHKLTHGQQCSGPPGLGWCLSGKQRSLLGVGVIEEGDQSQAQVGDRGLELATWGVAPPRREMLVEIICRLPLIVGQFVSKGCLPLPDPREVCLCVFVPSWERTPVSVAL